MQVMQPSPAAATVTTGFVSGRSSRHSSTAVGTQLFTGTGACPTNTYCVWLPQASLSGNAITLGIEYSSTPANTFTVTTDQSQTMTQIAATTAVSSRLATAFYLCNATAGTREIQIANSAAITIDEVFVEQWAGIASTSCLDNSGVNQSGTAGTTLTGPTVTHTAGSLIVNHAYRAGTPLCTSTPCFTAATSFTLRGTDYTDGGMMEYFIDSGTSITPSPTTATSSTFLDTVMALKVDSTKGTNPTGMYVIYQGPCDTPTLAATTQKCQFPSSGNLLVALDNGGGPYITSVTDATNTWKLANNEGSRINVSNYVSAISLDSAYVPNASANATGAITFNLNNTVDNDLTLMLFDIAGAATTAPLGNAAAIFANDVSTGATYTFFSNYYPGITDGLVLASTSQNTNTTVAITSPSGGLTESSTYGGQSRDGPSLPDQNNTWGLLHNSSASSQTWTAGYVDAHQRGLIQSQVLSFMSATGANSGIRIVQQAKNETTSCSATCTIAVGSGQGWASSGANALIAVVGDVNTRTISTVCTDGTTCAAGNTFTCVGAAANGALETRVCYLIGHAAGVTTVTAKYSGTSGSALNLEMAVYEVAGPSAVDQSNGTTGTTSGGVDVGASITTTGTPSIACGITSVSGASQSQPAASNIFGYGDIMFTATTDMAGCMIATAGTYHYDITDSGTSTYANSIVSLK